MSGFTYRTVTCDLAYISRVPVFINLESLDWPVIKAHIEGVLSGWPVQTSSLYRVSFDPQLSKLPVVVVIGVNLGQPNFEAGHRTDCSVHLVLSCGLCIPRHRKLNQVTLSQVYLHSWCSCPVLCWFSFRTLPRIIDLSQALIRSHGHRVASR